MKCPELISAIGGAQFEERAAIEIIVRWAEQERDAVISDTEGAKVAGQRPYIGCADLRSGVSTIQEHSIDVAPGGGRHEVSEKGATGFQVDDP